jgi:hypothetical protein
MEVSGRLHPPDKQPPLLIELEAAWALEAVWILWKRETLPGIEPRPSQPVAVQT